MKALYVACVAMCRCESCTLRKNEKTRFDAFEMQGQRKILRVSWTAKKTNEWVLNKAGVKRHCQSKEASLLWSHHEEMELPGLKKEVMQGTMPGALRRGRPRTAWMDNIKTSTGVDSAWKSQSK